MAADFRAARPEKAARELVIGPPVSRRDAALTSPSRSLESVIGHCISDRPFPKFPIRSAASYVCKRNCSTSIDKVLLDRAEPPLMVQTRPSEIGHRVSRCDPAICPKLDEQRKWLARARNNTIAE
jgi:hypothetical protein